jgi:hypothetical protein
MAGRHINYWEHEQPADDPLPRDADGNTCAPTEEMLLEQLKRLRMIQEAERQLALRRWDQR